MNDTEIGYNKAAEAEMKSSGAAKLRYDIMVQAAEDDVYAVFRVEGEDGLKRLTTSNNSALKKDIAQSLLDELNRFDTAFDEVVRVSEEENVSLLKESHVDAQTPNKISSLLTMPLKKGKVSSPTGLSTFWRTYPDGTHPDYNAAKLSPVRTAYKVAGSASRFHASEIIGDRYSNNYSAAHAIVHSTVGVAFASIDLPKFIPVQVCGRKAPPVTLHSDGRQVMNIIGKGELNKRIVDFSERVISPVLKGCDATFVPIMNGGMFFCTALAQEAEGTNFEIMPVPTRSYGDSRTSGPVTISRDLISPEMIEGRTVFVIDDILETGNTAAEVVQLIKQHNPARVFTVFLTRKMIDEEPAIKPDYWLFEVHAESWVFGYGMDLAEKYRGLKFICDARTDLYHRDGTPKY